MFILISTELPHHDENSWFDFERNAQMVEMQKEEPSYQGRKKKRSILI